MKHRKWTFKGIRYHDDPRIVYARTEEDARHLAMIARWGAPTGIYAPRYAGVGLTLVSEEPMDEADV